MKRRFGFIWLALLLALAPALMGASSSRGYTTGRYGLELDGKFVGWLSSAQGGNAFADVITEDPGDSALQKKHIGNVKYEDIRISFGDGMSKNLYDWIQASLDRQYQRKDGAIIAADYNNREIARIEFHSALVTEIGMPALDAASKDAAKMTIKISPEYTRRDTSHRGETISSSFKGAQKAWLPANFRLKIDGLDAATSRVNKIEAITIKQKTTTDDIGDGRDYEQEPGKLEFPNLKFTLAEPYADPIYNWADAFIIQGQSSDEFERGGTLEYLDVKGATLFTLTFTNLGVFKVSPDKVEAGSENVRRVKAELYCEQMQFSYSAKAAQ